LISLVDAWSSVTTMSTKVAPSLTARGLTRKYGMDAPRCGTQRGRREALSGKGRTWRRNVRAAACQGRMSWRLCFGPAQHESGPVERMLPGAPRGVAHARLGALQRAGWILVATQSFVDAAHQCTGAAILDAPEARDHRARTAPREHRGEPVDLAAV